MYQELVKLITDLVFDGSVSGTMYGQLIVEGLAAVVVVLLVLLPLILVWRIVKRLL